MATINGMYVNVEREEPDYGNDITSQPIENGIDITDHVQRKPRSMAISGYIIGENAAEIRQSLIFASDSGSIVAYEGRNSFVGVIEGLSTGHDANVSNGCSFSLTLKEVIIAQSSYVETLPAPIRAQAAPVISSGRKQTQKGKKGKEEVQQVTFKAGSPWAGG